MQIRFESEIIAFFRSEHWTYVSTDTSWILNIFFIVSLLNFLNKSKYNFVHWVMWFEFHYSFIFFESQWVLNADNEVKEHLINWSVNIWRFSNEIFNLKYFIYRFKSYHKIRNAKRRLVNDSVKTNIKWIIFFLCAKYYLFSFPMWSSQLPYSHCPVHCIIKNAKIKCKCSS